MSIPDATVQSSGIRAQSGDGTLAGAISRQSRIIGALILRDMKTRFGANILSFALSVLWTVAHALLILAIYLITARAPSFGTSIIWWSISGGLPFVIFVYTSRWVGFAVSQNAALLTFPVISSFDLILSRIILEIPSSTLSTLILFSIVLIDGEPLQVGNITIALLGLISAYAYGVALGVFFSPFVSMSAFGGVALSLFQILTWSTCGALFLPDSLPTQIIYYLSFNPLLHAVELFRMGFYPNYVSFTFDGQYLLFSTLTLLMVGLAMDRIRPR